MAVTALSSVALELDSCTSLSTSSGLEVLSQFPIRYIDVVRALMSAVDVDVSTPTWTHIRKWCEYTDLKRPRTGIRVRGPKPPRRRRDGPVVGARRVNTIEGPIQSQYPVSAVNCTRKLM